MGEAFLTNTGIVESIAIHLEMLLSDKIKAHAIIDPKTHDLPFQVFRLLGGYEEALKQIDNLKAVLAERRGLYYERDVPHQSQHPHCRCRKCVDTKVHVALHGEGKSNAETNTHG